MLVELLPEPASAVCSNKATSRERATEKDNSPHHSHKNLQTIQPMLTATSSDPLIALLRSPPSTIPVSCSQEASNMTIDWSSFPVLTSEDLLSSSMWSPPPSPTPTDDEEEEETLYTPVSPCASIESFYTTADAACEEEPSRGRRVRFSPLLEIRSYNVVLGDHPCCLGGMAIDMGWDYETELLDLNVYEDSAEKRRQAQLRLSYGERRELLQTSLGVTGAELLQMEFAMICGGAKPLAPTPSVQRALAELQL